MKKLIGLALLLVMFSLSIVSAGTLTAPAANEEICGETYTITYTSVLSDTVNVSIYRSLVNGSDPWTFLVSATNTSANQSSWSLTFDTTGETDGIGYVYNATSGISLNLFNGSATESDTSANINVDNTGPVITFGGSNTKDKSTEYVQDFYLSINANEEIRSAPTVDFKGKSFTLKNSTLFDWYYDFDWNELPDDTYTYVITTGSDNTTCGNTGTGISRSVTIYSKSSVAVKQAQQQQQIEVVEQKEQSKTLLVVVAAVLVYFIFFRGKKGRKK